MIRAHRAPSHYPFYRLVEACYQAALEPAGWNQFLRLLGDATKAPMVALSVFRADQQSCSIAFNHGMDPEALAAYNRHFGRIDEWFRRGIRVQYSGWVGPNQQICADDEIRRTEFYNDFVRAFHMENQCGAVIAKQPQLAAQIALLRPRRKGMFDQSATDILHALMPHLQLALQIHLKQSEITSLSGNFEFALDAFSAGVVFLDRIGQVVHMNRAAKRMLAAKNGLAMQGRRVCAGLPTEQRDLQRLIQLARCQPSAEGLALGGTLLVSRSFPALPLSLVVAPLTQANRHISGSAEVVLYLEDPEAKRMHAASFARFFGLTKAEAEVARLLVAGSSLQSIADFRGVSTETVRSQVKSLFSKTRTRRQGELIAVLSRASSSLAP